MGGHFLLSGIFLMQGLTPHPLHLLRWQTVSLSLHNPGVLCPQLAAQEDGKASNTFSASREKLGFAGWNKEWGSYWVDFQQCLL